MRLVVGRLNRQADGDFGRNVTLLGVTPIWFGAAQDCCGGSPASQPVPTEPYGGRIRYAPQPEVLDRVHAAARAKRAAESVQVAILDTAPQQADIDWAVAHFPNNGHLHELMERLIAPVGSLPVAELDAALQLALHSVERNGGFVPIEPPEPFDIRDHGLFVASVVHAAAPWVRLRLVRVLNNFGVGSVHTLVIALIALLQSKSPDERLTINLSLGMLPALEQLAHIWFGLPINGLPGCPEDPSLQFLEDRNVSPDELRDLVEREDGGIQGVVDQLHAPVRQLMDTLRSHNCLIVAAAGNDSVFRGVERTPRWSPRIPALYDSVLGVAADTIRPAVPARYSNRGEIPAAAIRDAVATLGGDLAPDGLSPTGGVIGVYSAPQFPPLLPPAGPAPNNTGWAEWAGTSFATPIMSGIAANLWATEPAKVSTEILKDINAAARTGAPPDVPDLGVPGVPVRLTWLP
jgi:hypothetical protein